MNDAALQLGIISSDNVFGPAVERALSAFEGIEIIWSYHLDAELSDELARQPVSHALIEYSEDGEAAVRAAREVRQKFPKISIIVAGVPCRADRLLDLIEAGASGFLMNDADEEELIFALESVGHRRAYSPAELTACVFEGVGEWARRSSRSLTRDLVSLSARELQVASELSRGLSNKEIAQRLNVSPQTIKNHMHNILKKLHLNNRVEVAQYARNHDLVG